MLSVLGSRAVKDKPGNQAREGVGVIVRTQDSAYPPGVTPKARANSGIMTAGDERMAYARK
ncbi:MAG TPA: hypothetical protein VF598_06215 [Hymenobacter sp.]|jgi:hypothetical protein